MPRRSSSAYANWDSPTPIGMTRRHRPSSGACCRFHYYHCIDIAPGFHELKSLLASQSATSATMTQLLRSVERQWINKSTRLSVRDNQQFNGELSCRSTAKNQSVTPKLVCISGPSPSSSRCKSSQPWNDNSPREETQVHHQRYYLCVGSTTTSTPDSNF